MAAVSHFRTLLGLAAILIAAAAIYLSHLGSAPVYVAADEAHFALHASALAERGTDFNGNPRPVFFKITDPLAPIDYMRVWYQPFLFYVLALDFSILPVNEFSARLPVALIGLINIGLIFLVGRRLFQSDNAALLCAATLALTPAHFLFSRQAVDYICLLPFVLIWLWGVIAFSQTRARIYWLAAMLSLGVGLYTYIASWAVMPLLAVLSVLVVRPGWRNLLAGVGAFVLPTLGLMPLQPGMLTILTDIVTRYRLTGTSSAAAQPLAAIANFNLAERVRLYWDYFDPSFLLFAGGSDLMMATSRAGVFLLPVGVLIAVGLIALLKRRTATDFLILAGFVLAPLPIVVTLPEAPHSSIGRALTMVPFGVLVAAAGAQFMWRRPSPAWRVAVIALLAVAPIQFMLFRSDYLSGYQERSAIRFDPNATREVVDAVVTLERQSPAPLVFLQDDGDNKGIRWKFYTRERGRDDLWTRTRYFRAEAIDQAATPVGSLLVMRANDPRAAALAAAGCRKVATIKGVGDFDATDIFRREQ